MARRNTNKIRRSFSILNVILLAIMIIYVLSMLVMFSWGFMTSLKTNVEFTIDKLALPKGHIWEWEWQNYATTLANMNVPIKGTRLFVTVPRMFFNSIVYTLGQAFLNCFMQCTMAYLAAKFNFKMSKVIYGIVVVVMVLPIVGAAPSEIQLLKAIGLYDNIVGVFILKSGWCGMYFLVFYAMFKGLPNDYIEAAYIDGAGNFMVYFKIIVPYVANTMLTIFLMTFIGVWGDYQTTVMYMPSNPTFAYGVHYFTLDTGTTTSYPPFKLASCFIMTAPILIMFIFLHKRIMGKIYTGGLKG